MKSFAYCIILLFCLSKCAWSQKVDQAEDLWPEYCMAMFEHLHHKEEYHIWENNYNIDYSAVKYMYVMIRSMYVKGETDLVEMEKVAADCTWARKEEEKNYEKENS